MKNDATDPLRPKVEARLAQQFATRLQQAERQITTEQAERLKALRLMAVAQIQPVSATAAVAQGRALSLAGPSLWRSWLFRFGSVLPLIVLVVGLLVLQDYQQERFIRVTADIDTALLLGDLPPAAYADPGFARYLKLER
ncbi:MULTISPECIES: DUF3619 family protein [unclassified Thiomonas]|uniref:DUF3619 family protein n=1 Tax=unclassified Thiomonas TaxID=2625466 RepID=UPI0004DBCB89|nr:MULTISPECIES: DUF3619 family protein [unclassified Thiomonas]MDD5000548.1 DUF3619 family protein [Thiomonas arsenitoxydans]CDW92969.1 putative transmembrane protein [Thiomonas sp. CB2]VDY06509.1 putative transmembrane protein [Thiomonas sp. Bio17B3]VDY10195.1 putative transmembrane protein [Thiomonas sp. Sup16B3]VDY14782.1 conserved hypothetical protein [Thiomonas sp. OC7]